MDTYISAVFSANVDTYISAIISANVDAYISAIFNSIEYTNKSTHGSALKYSQ